MSNIYVIIAISLCAHPKLPKYVEKIIISICTWHVTSHAQISGLHTSLGPATCHLKQMHSDETRGWMDSEMVPTFVTVGGTHPASFALIISAHTIDRFALINAIQTVTDPGAVNVVKSRITTRLYRTIDYKVRYICKSVANTQSCNTKLIATIVSIVVIVTLQTV